MVKRNARTAWRLLKIYLKMDLLWLLRDTRICLIYIFSDSVVSLSSVVGMVLLAQRLGPSTGMAQSELLFMLGCALLVQGLYALVFTNNNAGAVSRIIGRGQLDHALIQPVPLPLHLLLSGVAPFTGCGTFFCGLGLTLWAAGGVALPPLWGLRLLGLLALALVILAAWVFAISSAAFWAPYAAEEIAPEVTDLFFSLSAYPLGSLSPLAQVVLCGVLPVGAMAWLPASLLMGKLPGGWGLALLAGAAAVFTLIASLLFRKGLKHYAKVSSPRYSGFGR